MKSLWEKISEHIVAPTKLNRSELLPLMLPFGRSMDLERHAAAVIKARVQLIAALFAVLVPLFSVVDLWVFEPDVAWPLVGLRLVSSAVFLALAWPRELSPIHGYKQAMGALLVLLLVPTLFNLFTADLLAQAPLNDTQRVMSQLYAYLPMVVLGGLAIFPLTVLESFVIALPVIGLGVGSTLLADGPVAWEQHLGTLWFMTMMLGVAMFSGMSQCHYMATLVLKASNDTLTNAYTRRSGEEALNLLFRLNQMAGKSLTVVFFDLDRFKSINDTYGHDAGDVCLKTMADRIRACLRRSDLLVRWGGEEFIAVLPDTPLEAVPVLLGRLRELGLGERPDGTPLTVSMGVAHSKEAEVLGWEVLVTRADQRMYQSKQNGRNRLTWPDGTEEPLFSTS
jgi:diguanylate cyclase (GGDEF)-like protein